jgi:SpoU rRNA methylase family enzyme
MYKFAKELAIAFSIRGVLVVSQPYGSVAFVGVTELAPIANSKQTSVVLNQTLVVSFDSIEGSQRKVPSC